MNKPLLLQDLEDKKIDYLHIETMPCDFTDLPAATVTAVALLLFQPEKRWVIFCYDANENFIGFEFRVL